MKNIKAEPCKYCGIVPSIANYRFGELKLRRDKNGKTYYRSEFKIYCDTHLKNCTKYHLRREDAIAEWNVLQEQPKDEKTAQAYHVPNGDERRKGSVQ